jgi:hypothetical protein
MVLIRTTPNRIVMRSKPPDLESRVWIFKRPCSNLRRPRSDQRPDFNAAKGYRPSNPLRPSTDRWSRANTMPNLILFVPSPSNGYHTSSTPVHPPAEMNRTGRQCHWPVPCTSCIRGPNHELNTTTRCPPQDELDRQVDYRVGFAKCPGHHIWRIHSGGRGPVRNSAAPIHPINTEDRYTHAVSICEDY